METFVLLYLATALAVWIYRSFRSLSELAHAPELRVSPQNTRTGSVSILIPAKNEEKNIADCVKSLLTQLRENDEIIVINNCSSDRTEIILKELGALEITENRRPSPQKKTSPILKYLNTPKTPDGWTGKNFALHLGKNHATGDWFLFTDADTRHQPGGVDASVAYAEKEALDLLTLFPRCLAHGFWENLIQPCAMGYMGLWFPVRKINDPKSKICFGNGQYLLVRKDHYLGFGGHEALKEAFLEDFAMMKKTKESGARGLCAFGMEVYGTRMYDSFNSLWRGWRRIYLHAFEQNPWRLSRCVSSVFFFSVLPFLILPFLAGHNAAFIAGALLVGILLATAFKTHSIVRANRMAALLHPLAAMVFTIILFDSFLMAALKKPTFWR